jgi:hypothetical protein
MKRFVFVFEKDHKVTKQMVFAKSFREACERVDAIMFAWNLNPQDIMEVREYA